MVPAAGRGERLGPGTPKALRPLGGVPMLVHAVRLLAAARSVDLIVVAAPRDDVEAVAVLLADHGVGAGSATHVEVVPGGDDRQSSVGRALLALPADVDVVLVHDAARPLAPVELVDQVAAAVRDGAPAVVPGLAVTDTIKEVDGAGRVVATPVRAALRAVQTPQGFRRAVLQAAHAATTADAVADTDDAGLVERNGGTVLVIAGHADAFKVTRPLDLVLAEAVLARRRAAGVVG